MSATRTISRDELTRVLDANGQVIDAAKQLIKLAQEDPSLEPKLTTVIGTLLKSTQTVTTVAQDVSGVVLPRMRG